MIKNFVIDTITFNLFNSYTVTYLRQCVIDVFCSTSTERSRNDSSLLLT